VRYPSKQTLSELGCPPSALAEVAQWRSAPKNADPQAHPQRGRVGGDSNKEIRGFCAGERTLTRDFL
jgi:hypothetical protein